MATRAGLRGRAAAAAPAVRTAFTIQVRSVGPPGAYPSPAWAAATSTSPMSLDVRIRNTAATVPSMRAPSTAGTAPSSARSRTSATGYARFAAVPRGSRCWAVTAGVMNTDAATAVTPSAPTSPSSQVLARNRDTRERSRARVAT